jgi:hypothetical protein
MCHFIRTMRPKISITMLPISRPRGRRLSRIISRRAFFCALLCKRVIGMPKSYRQKGLWILPNLCQKLRKSYRSVPCIRWKTSLGARGIWHCNTSGLDLGLLLLQITTQGLRQLIATVVSHLIQKHKTTSGRF